MMRQIVLDTETTGLSTAEGHRIIEIGCVEMINRRYTGKVVHHYFNPDRSVDAAALQVHGIEEAFLATQPRFAAQAEALLEFLKGAELVIHNAPFDVGFLNYEFQQLSADFKELTEYCTVLDTLLLARQKHPGQHNSLDALCRRYQVDNSQRDYHGALLDARLLAEVYLAMTGGQGTLFEETQTSFHSTTARRQLKPRDHSLKLPVQYASAAELESHAQRMAVIAKKSGFARWD